MNTTLVFALRSSQTKQPTRATPRYLLAISFILLLGCLNTLLYTQLKPIEQQFSRLPLGFPEQLEAWLGLSGSWRLEGNRLEQTAAGLAIMATPIQLPTAGVRLHISLTPQAGISFHGQRQHEWRLRHVLWYAADTLLLGYLDEAGAWHEQARWLLTGSAPSLSLSLLIAQDHYHVLIDHQPVLSFIPLQYQAGNLALVTQGPATFDAFWLDAELSGLKRLEATHSPSALESEP